MKRANIPPRAKQIGLGTATHGLEQRSGEPQGVLPRLGAGFRRLEVSALGDAVGAVCLFGSMWIGLFLAGVW